MKAPFEKGDVVVRVPVKDAPVEPGDPTIIGHIYIMEEVRWLELMLAWGVRVVGPSYTKNGVRSMWHHPLCFRLYEPPKPETMPGSERTPVEAMG